MTIEAFPEGRPLGASLAERCRPAYDHLSLAPGVSRDWTIYEFARVLSEIPVGKIRLPKIRFVGVAYQHLSKPERFAESERIRAEAMAKCWEEYDGPSPKLWRGGGV